MVRFMMTMMLVSMMCLTSMGVGAMTEQTAHVPSPPREFRAAWVATVANIDWPSEPGLSTEEQKQEAIAILDKSAELNLNAIVFQVRPQADALYKSELEPWSFYLTGKQGTPPAPYYDPLEFWVDQAHARGLELHAWFNPYRANHPANTAGISDDSIVKTHPELVVKLGDKGYYWMDPARKEVQDHSVAVVMDVVKRYGIDGVHFDDYFYPYPSYNDGEDFPDDASWEKYKESGGAMSRGDWRRDAVNTFIQRLYNEIKEADPACKFGISPFGIWRPGHPESIQGLDQYDTLYADAKLWLNEGWVDYFTPQLYWPISQVPQSFPILLGWWKKQNNKDRHLWPGMSIGRAGREGGTTEVLNQVMVTRAMLLDAPGNIFFSMKTLMRNSGDVADKLKAGPYADNALVPRSPWLDTQPPATPEISVAKQEDERKISWKAAGEEQPFLWVVYMGARDKKTVSWNYRIVPSQQHSMVIEPGSIQHVAVSAVDRCGNESEKAQMSLK